MRVSDAEFVCAGRRISAKIMLSSQFFYSLGPFKAYAVNLWARPGLCSCAQFVDIIGHQGLNRLIVRQETERELVWLGVGG